MTKQYAERCFSSPLENTAGITARKTFNFSLFDLVLSPLELGNKCCCHIQAHFLLLPFAILLFTDTAFFYTLKVCDNFVWSKSVGDIFAAALAHFMPLCNILVILTIFQTLHQQKDYASLKAQMKVTFLAIKYFFN